MPKPDLIDRDLGWREIFRRVTHGGEAYAKVGIQQDTVRKQEDGQGPIDMVQLGAIHEFGAPKAGIPERSFVRAWHDSARTKITALQDRLGQQFIDGKITLRQMIAKLGAFGQGGMRKFLRDLKEPPLKASTVRQRRKGSDNPLVDTAQMLNSIHSVSVIRGVEVERTGP
jgi:hypothetical protein